MPLLSDSTFSAGTVAIWCHLNNCSVSHAPGCCKCSNTTTQGAIECDAEECRCTVHCELHPCVCTVSLRVAPLNFPVGTTENAWYGEKYQTGSSQVLRRRTVILASSSNSFGSPSGAIPSLFCLRSLDNIIFLVEAYHVYTIHSSRLLGRSSLISRRCRTLYRHTRPAFD